MQLSSSYAVLESFGSYRSIFEVVLQHAGQDVPHPEIRWRRFRQDPIHGFHVVDVRVPSDHVGDQVPRERAGHRLVCGLQPRAQQIFCFEVRLSREPSERIAVVHRESDGIEHLVATDAGLGLGVDFDPLLESADLSVGDKLVGVDVPRRLREPVPEGVLHDPLSAAERARVDPVRAGDKEVGLVQESAAP